MRSDLMARYLMGIDNGGTVIKAALYRLDGKEIAVASQHTPVFSPQPGYQQRDMEEVWQKNCACIRQVLKQAAISPEEVTALAVCGHGKGLYLWGKDGRPAYPGIASTDNRAWSYPGRWKESGIFSQLYPQLCQQQLACQPSALLAWLKDHEPTVYQNIQWVFSIKDYIRFRLTGTALSECTDLSGSGLMDVKNQCIDSQLLRTLGIEEAAEMIPPLCRSFDLCGQVTPEAAALTGLCPGTPVAGGMFDIDACAIAMAVTSPDQLCTITGTWSINEFISTQPKLGTKVAMNSLYAIPGYYLLEECSPTSAGNLEWNLKQLAAGLDLPQGQSLYDGVNHLVDSISPEDCQVYYLPFLYGSNAHPLAKASFLGLTSYHTAAHMLRAVFEGVAFSHKVHIDRLLTARQAPSVIRMGGGAANSAVWSQMFADVLNLPIQQVSGVRELGALGCAMAAGVAAGIYTDYSQAAQAMVRMGTPILPDPDRHAIYQSKFETYQAISSALDTIWDRFIV